MFEFKGSSLICTAFGEEFDFKKQGRQNYLIKTMEVVDGSLEIYFSLFSSLIHDSGCTTTVTVNGAAVPVEIIDIYSLQKVFGISVSKETTFVVRIPLTILDQKRSSIEFMLEAQGETNNLPLQFYRSASKLNERISGNHWTVMPGYIAQYSNTSIVIRKTTRFQRFKREMRYQFNALKYIARKVAGKKSKKRHLVTFVCLRNICHIFNAIYAKQRIWIYFDKLFKGGDNGEYLFSYAVNQRKADDIRHYYIINRDCPDYTRLKKQYGNKILIFGTLRCKLYALLSENVVATHPDIIEFMGFDKVEKKVFNDLFNPNLICIAHGVTIQKNADYQNKLFDHTMFYTTSSKYEVDHILKPAYGYKPNEVALTGMARFDGLINKDKKQILITPTWRRNLAGTARRNTTRKYVTSFKETEYYRIYNSLINDERILEKAKECGYRIMFLLHPAMSAQIDDYDTNDYVDIVPAAGGMSYEKVLTESSLMITDYSGIHYDFGYMRKPVIYYQPKEVPMRFEEGGMKFKTMGFGPVCTEYEEAVSLICDFMGKKCAMPEQFKNNCDDFFAFSDHHNCERIYEAISSWTDKRSTNKYGAPKR